MINIGQLIAGLGVDTAPFQRAMNEAQMSAEQASRRMEQGMRNFDDSMKRVGKRMEGIGKKMSMYVTLPLVAAGVGAMKLSMAFETSMTKITSLVGVASDQVDEWGQDIIKLAPEIGKTPTELADALFFVTSAGLRGAEAMDALTYSAKASAAGLGETKVVADLVTSAMNAYGSDVLDASMATDVLVGAVREGKAEADALAGSMGQVLPIASEMGVTFDQVGAAQAAMTRTGTNAATAATQLRAIMVSLMKPTDQVEATLNEMGSSAKELRQSIRDDGLINVLMHLKELAAENGKEMAELFPNVRALAGVLDLTGANAAENVALFDRMTDTVGLTNDAFEVASDTLEHKWNQFLAQNQSLLIQLGDTLAAIVIPAMEGLTAVLGRLSNWFNSLSESQQRWVVYIGMAVAAMGPLLMVTGKFLQILPYLRNAIIATRTAMIALNTVIAANPIGALVTVLTTAAASMYLFRGRTKDASDEMKELADLEVGDPGEVFKTWSLEVGKLSSRLSGLNKGELQNFENWLKSEALPQSIREFNKWGKQVEFEMENFGYLTTVTAREVAKAEENINAYQGALELTGDELERFNIIAQEVAEGLEAQNAKVIDLTEIMGQYSAAIEMANLRSSVFGEEFDKNKAQIDAVRRAIEDLLEKGIRPGNAELDTLSGHFRDLNTETLDLAGGMLMVADSVAEINAKVDEGGLDALNNQLAIAKERTEGLEEVTRFNIHAMADWEAVSLRASESVASAFMNAAMTGRNATSDIIKQLLAQVTAQLIASMITKIPFPFNLVVAGGAGALAGAIFKKTIPAFADGAVISGPTLGMVGEYSGARTNPEIIAPLDKLESLLDKKYKGGTGNLRLTHRMDKGDILFIVDEAREAYNRTF